MFKFVIFFNVDDMVIFLENLDDFKKNIKFFFLNIVFCENIVLLLKRLKC